MRTEQSDSSTPQQLAHGLDGPAPFRRVREYVDAHLGSRLDVPVLARIVGLSASHFSRSFQKAVGVSPHRYVVQCRLKRARELLATTQLSLTEIALTMAALNQGLVAMYRAGRFAGEEEFRAAYRAATRHCFRSFLKEAK